MTLRSLPLATLVALLLSGCGEHAVYAPVPPPPPPAYGPGLPSLVQLAERNGSRAGFDDGQRDAYYHAGYTPQRDQRFHDAPGYDYRLGPIGPYVQAFRDAYLRGYERGFRQL